MVLCVVIGWSKHSEHDKAVSFHRIPAVYGRKGKKEFELRKK